MTKQHHSACALNLGEDHCNCMHPKVVVIRSVYGDHVSFSDYLSLEADRERLRKGLQGLLNSDHLEIEGYRIVRELLTGDDHG